MSRYVAERQTWESSIVLLQERGRGGWNHGGDSRSELEDIDEIPSIEDFIDNWNCSNVAIVQRIKDLLADFRSRSQSRRRVSSFYDSQSSSLFVGFEPAEEDRPVWQDSVDSEAPSPEDILSGLKTESDPVRRRLLIFHAEDAHFSDSQREELAPLLLDFIEQNRDSNNRLDVIATASAIRRYVSVLRIEDLGKVVPLLRPRDGVTASPENQLEILKMLARTYEVLPPAQENPEPDLAKEVFRVAEAHLNPYVFEGEMHAAIALHACLALAGMASPEAREAYSQARDLPFVWFRKLVRRETQKVENLWEAKADSTILQRLRKLVEILDAAQPAEAEVARPSA